MQEPLKILSIFPYLCSNGGTKGVLIVEKTSGMNGALGS